MSGLLPAVSVRRLVKTYRDGGRERRVLDGTEFTARHGECIALWGPSGSGKSTLLNIIAGLVRPDAGEVLVRPVDGSAKGDDLIAVHALSASQATRYRRRCLGYVFQFFNLVPTLTVEENIRLPLSLNGLERTWPEAKARLDRLGLGDRLDAFPGILSGGERQRVAIARALAHRPSIVLADEPTGNLDAANTETVAALLFEAVRTEGATLLLATHDASLAARADRRVDLTPP
jgi:putative ABC transport system ATP-binding protein